MRRPEQTVTRRAIAGALVLAAALTACGGEAGSRSSLSAVADSLRSQAAEGAILARDSASGGSTAIFTREHAADLLGLVASEKASLGSARVDPALEPQLSRLLAVADRVETDLRQLSSTNGDPSAASRDLQAAADESRSIGEDLS